ncbi:DUF7525 family protein [Halalkalirubrum salinum]|uniref:DUF7525 family protein n=1 Tax=Halalkalirubrum salinum TaxID=2563889 RepID=UPI0010FB0837|nr:hypothetical protein [Halalkalirubrum salinum]
MATGTVKSDKAIGIGMAFTALTLLGVVLMYAGETQLLKAWGFAAAMIAASIAVVGLHAFE